MKTNSYALAAISAFVIWGFIAFPLKTLSPYPSSQILFYRILLALVCLPLLLIAFRKRAMIDACQLYKTSSRKQRMSSLVAIVLSSFLLTANWLLFIYVVNHVSLQTASFAYLLCPILTAFLAFIILKEQLKSQQWMAVGISLLSCCMLGIDSLGNMAYSLLIALSYALYLVAQRFIKGYDKMVVLTLQVLLSFILIYCMGENFRGTAPVALRFYVIIFVLSTIFTILPLFLNLFALKELKSATVGILMYINPMVSFMVAFLYFNEQASILQLLAYLLIFLSVILFTSKIDFLRKKNIPGRHSVRM